MDWRAEPVRQSRILQLGIRDATQARSLGVRTDRGSPEILFEKIE